MPWHACIVESRRRRLRDSTRTLATLSSRLFRQQARALVEEELGPVATEVGGLGNTIHDTAALTNDVEVGGEGALGRPLVGVRGVTEPHRAAEPVCLPILIDEL